MNGQHVRGTPIVVDYWRIKKLPPRMLFFLTHMHAGRYKNLGLASVYMFEMYKQITPVD